MDLNNAYNITRKSVCRNFVGILSYYLDVNLEQ